MSLFASPQVSEETTNLISETTRMEGKFTFDHTTRVHGTLIGEIHAKDGSTLILGQTAVIEGHIKADTLIVDGYVRGDIHTKTKLVLKSSGRIIGNIKTKSLIIDAGAYFEGTTQMEEKPQSRLDLHEIQRSF